MLSPADAGVRAVIAFGVATDFLLGACRAVDPFLKKEWYDIKAPSMFQQRQVGKTLITRTQGTKVRGLQGMDSGPMPYNSSWLRCDMLIGSFE